MLRYFYTCKYSDGFDKRTEWKIDDNPCLTLNARIYALVDKYGVLLLKQVAIRKFENTRAQFRMAQSPTLLHVIKSVYTTTPSHDRELRDCVLPKLLEYRRVLADCDAYIDLIKKGLADGEFAADVFKTMARDESWRIGLYLQRMLGGGYGRRGSGR